MAGLHFNITGDNSDFMNALRETETGIKNTAKSVESSGMSIETMFGKLSKAAAGIGAAFSAQQFAGQVMKVRGEFQQLEVAFNTMLGSAEKANELMTQLTRTAAVTPFGLQDVAQGAKQLLAYGVASEEVNDTLVRLGDIAAGLSIPLNDLVYLYGTTMTQGRMFTQDLRQFQGRGIPLADELAKQFDVTKDKVGELVTEGKVGFEEMHKAIVSMTSDGGKFGGLMEAQSKTITGQISNIEDAIDGMFNQIGQSSEGVINEALGGVSKLVENWEKVAEAIGYAASAYGSYKAALMVTSAVEGVKTDIASSEEIKGMTELLGLKEESKNADLEAAVAKGTLTQAKAQQMAVLREGVEARLVSLKLMQEEALAEEKAALDAFNLAKIEKDAADERLENMMNLMEAAEAQGDASYTAYAQEQLQTASATANTAATRLNTAEKNLNAASSKAKAASEAADTFATKANTIANNANTKSLNLMKAAALQLQGILKSMYATLMANPLAIVVAAIGALTYGIYSYATRAGAAEKVTKQFNGALEEQSKKHETHKKAIDELVSSLESAETSEGKRIENFQKLKAEYPEILKDIQNETQFLKEKHKILQLINKEQRKEQQKEDENLLYQAEAKLKRWEQHRKQYGETSVVDVDGNGWASDNVTEAINAQRDIVNQLKEKISQPIVESYLESIKELKDEDIVSTIEEITNTLVALEGAGDNAIGLLSSMGREFSKAQLKTIKSALIGEQSSRGGEKNSAAQWLAKYKKEYESAEKAITDFQKKAATMSEALYEKTLKELKDKRDAAKKRYEEAGGSTKTDNKQLESQKKISEEILSMRRKTEQDEINLLEEGGEKRRRQIELNYQQEIDEIEKQKKAWKEAQGGKLTDEQHAEIGRRYVAAEDTRNSGLAKITKEEIEAANQSMNEYLAQYGDYMQKRKAITDMYTQKMSKATTKGEKLMLAEQMKRELAAVDDEVQGQTNSIAKLFQDMSEKSVASMREIADEAELALAYLDTGKWEEVGSTGKDAFGFTKEQYDLLRNNVQALKDAREGIKNIKKEADNLEPTLKKMSKGFKDIFSGDYGEGKFEEKLGDVLSGVGEITKSAEFLGNSLATLSEAFGSGFLGGLAEGIGVATEAANAAMSGAQAGKVFGPWGAAAGAAIGAVTSLASSFAKLHDKKNERKIQKIQEQIEVLEKSYERLGDEIEDAYSKDASKLIQDQNKLLEQQKVLIQNQIKEEEKKKKTDNDRIKEWKEQIEEINKTISENKEAAVDAIFGSDLKSAIDEFSSAYVEAWGTGEDKAKSSKEVVESMIKSMIAEAVKASSSAPMEKIRQKLLEFWSDSFISAAEQEYINNMVAELQEKLDKQFGWADNLFKEENEVDTSSVDDFISSVSSGLQSLEVTAKDVSDNIYDYFRQAMINALYDKTYAEAMKKLYEEFESYMSDNSISDEELNILSEKIDSYVSQISSGIGKINEMFADKLKEEKPEEDIEDGFKSFSDNILNIMSNAETEAEDIANNISNNLRQKLFESMYVEQYEPRIKEIWEEWKKITSDGVVTDEERERIKQNIQDISNEVAKASKEMSEGWVEAGEEVNEAFKSFSESIRSVLYNAESTAEDVAKNIYEYMRKAFIDASFASQLEPLVQEWFDLYEGFNADNLISDTERAELDKLIADISKAGESLNDAANKLFPSLDTGAQKAAKEAEEAARKAEEEAREAAEKAAAEAQRIREQAESEWQSFSDNVVSSLYDIEATSADISKDMGETMRQALIKAMYVKNYEPQMRKWYNAWQSAMGDGSLTDDEKSTLDSMKDAIINDAMKEVNAINQMFGSIYSQEATAKGFSAMSQETGEELNGRFTAIQIASEEMKNCVLRNVAIYEQMLSLNSQSNAMLSDILAQQAISNGYLSDIAKYTKAVSLFGDKLDSIVQNTKNL